MNDDVYPSPLRMKTPVTLLSRRSKNCRTPRLAQFDRKQRRDIALATPWYRKKNAIERQGAAFDLSMHAKNKAVPRRFIRAL